MPKSSRPRKPYRRPNYSGEAASLNPEKYGEQARAEQAGESQSAEQAHPEPVHIDKEPVAPAHPHVTHRAPRGRGRYLVPVAAGAGVIGGGAFLAHRARRRKATMAKALVNPLTGEGVTFEKRYIEDDVDQTRNGVLVAKGARDHAVRMVGRARKQVTTERAAIGSTGVLVGAALPRKKVDKRYDMTALEHTGSRRVGGRLPVSSHRVAGLPVQSATFSRGNPEARPGTRSHANKLTHVHTNVKASRTGKLLLVKHGSRSKSGTSIGKSAGYAQSGGHGRRLVNV